MTQPLAPITEDEASRARKIAAIHALADWYTKHPDEPMPSFVIASSTTWSHELQPEHDRVLAVTEFAHRHGADLTESWQEVTARLSLTVQDRMRVSILRHARLDDQAPRRYVS